MTKQKSESEVILYHLANRYLRQFLPEDLLKELQSNFEVAEQLLNDDTNLANWSQRVMWLSHWDGVLANNTDTDAFSATLSMAMLRNQQVEIKYQGNKYRSRFNVFGLIKRDATLLVVGCYAKNPEPFILAVHKIISVRLTDTPAIEPHEHFNLSNLILNRRMYCVDTRLFFVTERIKRLVSSVYYICTVEISLCR